MRLFTILRTFSKYRLDQFFPSGWQVLLFKLIFFWQPKVANISRGKGLRLFLEELGPVYIKLGQLMSVRRDLIPEDVADELIQLQDAVPPMDWQTVKAQIETGLKQPQVYQSIEQEAVSAASIARCT